MVSDVYYYVAFFVGAIVPGRVWVGLHEEHDVLSGVQIMYGTSDALVG